MTLMDLRASSYLAGMAFGHLLPSLVGDGSFTPLAFSGVPGNLELTRYVANQGDQVEAMFEETLAEKEWLGAAMAQDGYVTVPPGRFDAVLIHVAERHEDVTRVSLAVPYVPKKFLQPFTLRRLQVLPEVDPFAEEEVAEIVNGFWAGVDYTPEVSALYNRLVREWK